jgi:exodeoxyribonuclease V beta subunit
MDMLLAAVFEPHREGLVRAALMTRILGLDAQALDALGSDETAWDGWIGKFIAWRELWARHGFTPMIRSLLAGEGVRERLLGGRPAERALTNVLHIAELLGRPRPRRSSACRASEMARRTPEPCPSRERRVPAQARERRGRGEGHDRAQEQGPRVRNRVLPLCVEHEGPEEGGVRGVPRRGGPSLLRSGSPEYDDHRARAAREALARTFAFSMWRSPGRRTGATWPWQRCGRRRTRPWPTSCGALKVPTCSRA